MKRYEEVSRHLRVLVQAPLWMRPCGKDMEISF